MLRLKPTDGLNGAPSTGSEKIPPTPLNGRTKPTRWAVGRYSGEPVLRRWGSPRFIRHSGLADAAHRTDFRVEPLFDD